MKDYNMLIHYASFRKAVVSDIYLNELALSTDEKESIIYGLPLLRNCIVSIYDSIIAYAKNPKLPRMENSDYKNSGDIMKERRDAESYVTKTLASLYNIISDGIYDNDHVIAVSKDYLKNLELPLRSNRKFQQSHLKHFEYFCRIEYLKKGEISDWQSCDSIEFVFEDKELCFVLRHLIKNGVEIKYFQYGDFRIYSKAGQKEEKHIFPESVRIKALGNEKYNFYQKICDKTREILRIEQTGENTYQGEAYFQILCDYGELKKYTNTYKNTRITLCIKKDIIAVNLRLGFEAFNKLPEIFEKLTPNLTNAFLSLRQCQSPACPHKCTSKRFAVFNESIFPQKYLKPCQCDVASCNIESEDDINSIINVFEHIKKYTDKN